MEDTFPSPKQRNFYLSEERQTLAETSHFGPVLSQFSIPLNICIRDIVRVPVFGEGTPS